MSVEEVKMKKPEDDLVDLMPRFMTASTVRKEDKLDTSFRVYEFDQKSKKYKEVAEHELKREVKQTGNPGEISVGLKEGEAEKILVIPGSDSFYYIEGWRVTKVVNFKPRLRITLPKEVHGEKLLENSYKLRLALSDGTLFLRGPFELYKISQGQLEYTETGVSVDYVFLLEQEKLLVSANDETESEIFTLDLSLVKRVKAPMIKIQLSETRFVGKKSGYESNVWEYSKGDFVLIQTVPEVVAGVGDILICRRRGRWIGPLGGEHREPDSYFAMKWDGKEYKTLKSLEHVVYFSPIGKSLFMMNSSLRKVNDSGIKKLQYFPGLGSAGAAYPLPSTRSSRMDLVKRLGKDMSRIPETLVDIVVGFL